ncbi:hypothetical protein TCAL_14503 [Tigriopus californicus]|uniref:Uncharacterized protein n=1 Tax=Tigriopus californicus TaxID=6832 RepID=A0A553PT99_TIGCA|nr:hypothetical protein TCAL_14503 [Tigriopus californicus]
MKGAIKAERNVNLDLADLEASDQASDEAIDEASDEVDLVDGDFLEVDLEGEGLVVENLGVALKQVERSANLVEEVLVTVVSVVVDPAAPVDLAAADLAVVDLAAAEVADVVDLAAAEVADVVDSEVAVGLEVATDFAPAPSSEH